MFLKRLAFRVCRFTILALCVTLLLLSYVAGVVSALFGLVADGLQWFPCRYARALAMRVRELKRARRRAGVVA